MTETNQEKQPSIVLNHQYVKDSSFENPGAPANFSSIQEQPKIDVALDLNVNNIQDDTFEVATKIKTTATSGSTTLYIAEVTYAGVFTLRNIPDEAKEQILLIHCPTLTFPFVRRVLADLARDGGFPFMVDPIDFNTIYNHRKAQQAEQDNTTTAPTTSTEKPLKKNEKITEKV